MRMKRQFEKQGAWKYKSNRKAERLKAIQAAARKREHERERAEEAGFDVADAGTGAAGSLQITSKVPLPRTREICAWKGYDGEGNLYWCNNRVLVHPRTHEPFEQCG